MVPDGTSSRGDADPILGQNRLQRVVPGVRSSGHCPNERRVRPLARHSSDPSSLHRTWPTDRGVRPEVDRVELDAVMVSWSPACVATPGQESSEQPVLHARGPEDRILRPAPTQLDTLIESSCLAI